MLKDMVWNLKEVSFMKNIIRGFNKLQIIIAYLFRMCLLHAVLVEDYFSNVTSAMYRQNHDKGTITV